MAPARRSISTLESTPLAPAAPSASPAPIPFPLPARPRLRRALWRARQSLRPYVQIARVDHWCKNVFVSAGILLAAFYRPSVLALESLGSVAVALAVACLVASSNYVLNELLDAPFDRHHPDKHARPAASGLVRTPWALFEWLALALVGFALAGSLNPAFLASAVALWVMGVVYNVRPLRTKELPYLDVLSESLNNPIRLLLGWFALVPDTFPPLSLLIAYWMVGAYLMATKRFAEYRRIGNKLRASAYRRSFRYYDEGRLLVSMMFYATLCTLFSGVFIVRYKLELVLWAPMVAAFMATYLMLGLRQDGNTDAPEKLYRAKGFVVQAVATVALFVLLMLVDIPALYELFRVDPAGSVALWRLG